MLAVFILSLWQPLQYWTSIFLRSSVVAFAPIGALTGCADGKGLVAGGTFWAVALPRSCTPITPVRATIATEVRTLVKRLRVFVGDIVSCP